MWKKKWWNTGSSVLSESLVDLFHAFDVQSRHFQVVDHGQRVIFADDALGRPLHRFRRIPRLVDVLHREILQHRLVFPSFFFKEYFHLNFVEKKKEIFFFFFFTWLNRRWGRLCGRIWRDSSSGRIGGRTTNTTATSTCRRWPTNPHPAATLQTPEFVDKWIRNKHN